MVQSATNMIRFRNDLLLHRETLEARLMDVFDPGPFDTSSIANITEARKDVDDRFWNEIEDEIYAGRHSTFIKKKSDRTSVLTSTTPSFVPRGHPSLCCTEESTTF